MPFKDSGKFGAPKNVPSGKLTMNIHQHGGFSRQLVSFTGARVSRQMPGMQKLSWTIVTLLRAEVHLREGGERSKCRKL